MFIFLQCPNTYPNASQMVYPIWQATSCIYALNCLRESTISFLYPPSSSGFYLRHGNPIISLGFFTSPIQSQFTPSLAILKSSPHNFHTILSLYGLQLSIVKYRPLIYGSTSLYVLATYTKNTLIDSILYQCIPSIYSRSIIFSSAMSLWVFSDLSRNTNP